MVRTLELALSQGRRIASDDDQLCLAGSEGLERGFVSKSNYHERHMVNSIPLLRRLQAGVGFVRKPFPDFITNARRELMLSAVFFAFFVGAIAVL